MLIVRRVTLALLTVAVLAMATITALAWHHGDRLYVIHTGSMTPALKPGDVVFDKPARGGGRSTGAVKPGEIVTFLSDAHGTLVTHRVVSITDGIITTKGDANPTNDPWKLSAAQVVGQRITTLPRMGYALVYLRHPLGVASVLVSAVGLVLLWRLFFPPTQPRHRRQGEDGASPPSAGISVAATKPTLKPRHAAVGHDQPTTVAVRHVVDTVAGL